jgi:hypothetical protein
MRRQAVDGGCVGEGEEQPPSLSLIAVTGPAGARRVPAAMVAAASFIAQ